MVAVSEAGCALRAGPVFPADEVDGVPPPAARPSRTVAIAVSPMELLRPGSDLLATVAGVGPVDLLFACEDEPVPDPSPVCVLGGGVLVDACDDEDDDEPVDEVRAAVERLGCGELDVHRLGLRPPLGRAHEADLVAALSELIGFDPEPGVVCLAPTPLPGDPARAAVDRAVRRITQVYGLPVTRYRCLELSVVDV